MIDLSPARRRELRAAAHHLHPVVTIAGNGLTAAVLGEIDRSLQAHELIKVKVQGADRDAREALLAALCLELSAAPVQHIGNTLVVWRDRREDEAAAKTDAAPARAIKVATAKSAAAFAAAARRAALIKASADKRRVADKRARGTSRPGSGTRGR